jgi:hypothetical protein
MYASFQRLNQMTEFYEIWYELYATGATQTSYFFFSA